MRGRGKGFRAVAAAVTAAVVMVGGAGLAAADEITNSLDGTVDAVAEVMPLNVGGGARTTTLVVVAGNGDGKNGCNLTGSTTLTADVSSSAPSVATVSPGSITFTSCGDVRTLTVTPVAVGSATISLTQRANTTGGTFNLAPGTFVATVAPPANTAPSVSVAGVAPGGSYDLGSEPTPTCSVTDAEDGPSTFRATVALSGPDAGTGIGTAEATCSYTDAGGLTAVSSVSYSITDPSAPTVDATLDPAAPTGLNGWYTGDVSVGWTVTEPQSTSTLSTSGCVSSAATDQGENSFTCTASSSGGDTTKSVTVKRDTEPPAVTVTDVSGTPGSDGWFTGDVTVAFTATDATSGPATQTVEVDATTSGQGIEVLSPAFTDVAGNTAPAGTAKVTVKIDRTGPVVTFVEENGETGNDGWFTSAVDVVFEGSDAESGVSPARKSVTVTDEGVTAVDSPAFTNGAGLTTAAGAVQQTVRVDSRPPMVFGPVVTGTLGDDGWYLSPVDLSWSATDATSGMPLGASTKTTGIAAEGETVVPGETFTDVAGNAATGAGAVVRIDTLAPVVTGPTVPAPDGANGWHLGDVTAQWSATDETPGSGLRDADGLKTATSSGEGVVGIAAPTFKDVAGNATKGVDAGVKVDLAPPTSIIFTDGPAAGGSFPFGEVPAAPTGCTASDSGSGVASCVVTGYSTLPGVHTMTATATDVAGRSSTASRTYTVTYQTKGFYQPVDMNNVVNTVKAGSTVPLKFEVFGPSEVVDTSVVTGFAVTKSACGAATEDSVEFVTTGGTALRYDATAGQFVQNWATPKTGAGSCFKVVVTTQYGGTLTALFKLK